LRDATLTAAEVATGQPSIDGYDEMTVDEVTRRLEDLSGEELGRMREYERRNKNRTTLLEQIDRKADEASWGKTSAGASERRVRGSIRMPSSSGSARNTFGNREEGRTRPCESAVQTSMGYPPAT
jgi:hypothetical protein